jgi:hypothetical protein
VTKASPPVTCHSFSTTDCGLMTRRTGVLQAFAAAPFADLLPPAAARRIRLRFGGVELGQQFDQHVLDVADDRDVDLHPLRDRRRVDVDVDDLARMLAKCFGLPITRSSKRAPMAIRTSQCCIAMFAS